MIWILYADFTMKSRQQKVIADVFRMVRNDISQRLPAAPVRIDEISSKKALLACVDEIRKTNASVDEWHFIGYGTPLGPLLGSSEWPEEISAFEWTGLQIPFKPQAQAWFYMEGSGVWLAPFLAAAYKVTSYGCDHLTESKLPDMRAYPPEFWNQTADYNPIAALYAEAFSDITVRRDECRWLEEKLLQQKPEKVLDIGCGNGALLAYLSPKIKQGIGVDISREAIGIAARNNQSLQNLSFAVIEGPHLPFADHSINTIVSLLSFRYLDWDPVLEEMKRILVPYGHLLIVDMVASSPKLADWPSIAADKLKNYWSLRKRQSYKNALRKLVTHPGWRKMIDRHPMHLENEFVWYLKSRFPNGEMSVINRGVRAKILSFDSGPVR